MFVHFSLNTNNNRDIIFLFCNLPCPVKDKYSVMAGWPISFSPNVKPGVKRKQENVATKVDKRKYEDKREKIPLFGIIVKVATNCAPHTTGACYNFVPPSTLKTGF
jgi:hypothetical protein